MVLYINYRKIYPVYSNLLENLHKISYNLFKGVDIVLLTTLCYIEKDDKYLMLHRVKKEHDVNKDKWIGIGGKFEFGESPEDCLIREAHEEINYTLTNYKLRGIITFIFNNEEAEYMFLYTAQENITELPECNEGILEWVPKKDI